MSDDELETIVDGLVIDSVQVCVDQGTLPINLEQKSALAIGDESVFGGEVISEDDFYTNYETIKALGVGGQAKVIRSKNLKDEKSYIIKQMPLYENVQRMMDEARALKNLENPHIQRLYHFYHVINTRNHIDELFLVLEDFEGESLGKKLDARQGRRFTEEEIDTIDRQILEHLLLRIHGELFTEI